MITLNLSPAQADNLLAFLTRVNLKGSEAPALAILQQLIITAKNAAQQEPEEPTEKYPKNDD